MNSEVLIIIVGAAAATYLTRFPMMILSGRKKMPEWVIKYMSYIAPAVLTALIMPAIFIKQGKFNFSISNEYIIAAGITVLAAYIFKNMLASVLAGIGTVAILMYLF